MARTSRRTPRPGPLVALYADVDPEVKGRIDHWAAIADVKVWEVIEELVRLAQATEGHDGLPQGMAFTSPLLPDLNSPVPGADSSSAPPCLAVVVGVRSMHQREVRSLRSAQS